MTQFLLANFAVVCAGLIIWGLLRRGRIYEFPFLAGATFLSFALPQLLGLAKNPFLPPGALDKTIFMSVLCAAMCYLGHIACRRPMRAFNWDYDERRLLQVSAAMIFLGAYFFFIMSRLPQEMLEQSQWTGAPVAYLFLGQILTYGFIIALLIYVRSRSNVALGLVLYASSFYVEAIVFHGRRSDSVYFVLFILLALWFQRGWAAPRSLMLIALVFGGLMIHSIGDYRGISANEELGSSRWNQILEIDLLGNFTKIIDGGGVELINTVYDIEAVDRNASFDFGLVHWNQLIFNYVPAQLLGRDFKSSLYLDLFDPDPAWTEFNFVPATGSTLTGMDDSFRSFWYFGCLKFFLIAFVMCKINKAAMEGNITAQIMSMMMIVQAMETVTHTTHNFLSPWVHMAVFLLPFLLFAARRRHEPALESGVSH